MQGVADATARMREAVRALEATLARLRAARQRDGAHLRHTDVYALLDGEPRGGR
jgi:hypothetical protein